MPKIANRRSAHAAEAEAARARQKAHAAVAALSICAVLTCAQARAQRAQAAEATAPMLIEVAVARAGSAAAEASDLEAGVRAAVAEIAQSNVSQRIAVRIKAVAACANGESADRTAPATAPRGKPALIVGRLCDRGAVENARQAAADGSLYIETRATHPRVTMTAHTTTLRLARDTGRQGLDSGAFLAAQHADQPGGLVILHDRTKVNAGLAADVAAAWQQQSSAPQHTIGFKAGQIAYDVLTAQIAARKPAAIYLAAFPSEAQIIIEAVAKTRARATVYGRDVIAPLAERLWATRRSAPLVFRSMHPFQGVSLNPRFANRPVAWRKGFYAAMLGWTAWREVHTTAQSQPKARVGELAAHWLKTAKRSTGAMPSVRFTATGNLARPSFAANRPTDDGWQRVPDAAAH